ncbi:MAG: hypothetical protein JWM74_4429, partial [Myxococcaceae bacterium]|nr:hypothetical protein [Myxococcaceae bacterium]
VSVTRTSRDPEPLLAVSVGLPPDDPTSSMQMQGSFPQEMIGFK